MGLFGSQESLDYISPKPVHCPHCGTETVGAFCPNCGKRVKNKKTTKNKKWWKLYLMGFVLFSILGALGSAITESNSIPAGILAFEFLFTAMVLFVLLLIAIKQLINKQGFRNLKKIIVLNLLIACISFIGFGLLSGEVVTTSSKTVETREEYIASCNQYSYEDIARNPSAYEGERTVFTGCVMQIVKESENSVILLVNTSKDSFGIWKDAIYVEYQRKSNTEPRILKDDTIIFYGDLSGLKTYNAVLGNNISVPYLKAKYIDLTS